MGRALADEFRGTERFSIVRRLGAGGMGVVYEAFDHERQARVALKTLSRFDATALYLFKREFRALTELVHENIISLYELISDGDLWFFTMELIDDGAELIAYLEEQIGAPGPRQTPAGPELSSAPIAIHSSWLMDSLSGETIADTDATLDLDRSAVGHATGAAAAHASAPSGRAQATVLGVGSVGSGRIDAPLSARAGEAADVDAHAADAARPGAGEVEAEEPPRRDYARLREIFGQLGEGVQALHAAGKLHRDLKPTNVLVRRDTGRVLLLDFGLVADLEREAGAPSAPGEAGEAGGAGDDSGEISSRRVYKTQQGQVAGTIAYMAPEQACGVALDEASDWYAVGVMLYQALTGVLPISGTAAQMLYQKQIFDPRPPRALIPSVPADLDALCMELLARDPAQRPSGAELMHRLTGRAQPSRAHTATVDLAEATPFVGRGAHLSALRQALALMLGGHGVVFRVHGSSGAGKSTLVQHFLDEAGRAAGALVLTGRCYEQESVPYKAVDSLIDALTRYLLGDEEACAAVLGEGAVHGVGAELDALAVLSRLFPVLRRLPAVDAAADSLAHTSELRVMRQQAFAALRRLLGRLAEYRPLIVYIDDLHWGDGDSAALLAELLAPPDPPPLLLLAAYRSEYAETSECLRALGASALARGSAMTPGASGVAAGDLHRGELVVEPLGAEHARELAAQLLAIHGLRASESDLDEQGGDLRVEWIARASRGSALYVHELVRHLAGGRDLSTLSEQGLDHVLWLRISELAAPVRRLIEILAVAGQPVKLRQAQQVAELGAVPQRVLRDLRLGNLVRSSGPGLDDDIECFHDRVRESVLAHLQPEQLSGYHLALAQMFESGGEADPETIAAHYLAAGDAPRACRYYEDAAASALDSLAFDRAEAFYSLAVELAADDDTRVRLCEQRIHFYTDMARFDDAYACAREGLKLLGVKLPKGFVPPLFAADFAKASLRLRGRDIAGLVELPTMRDARREAAVRLMSAVAKAAYQIRPELCVAVATKIVNLCLAHGNTAECAIGYMVFGAIFQGGVLGRHRVGYDFGQLALALIERFGNHRLRAEVSFVVGYFGTSWLRPASEAEALWRVAYDSGVATGDLFHTGCAACCLVLGQLMRGAPIDEILASAEAVQPDLSRAGLRIPLGAIAAVRQTVRNLRDQTAGPVSLSDEGFDEAALVAELPSWGIRHFEHFYYLCKMALTYLRGTPAQALVAAERAAPFRKESRGMLHGAEHGFWLGLIAAAGYQHAPARKLLRTVRDEHAALSKLAEQCPENFAAKAQLVAAELSRCRGRALEALAGYAQCARLAGDSQQLQVEALACARAASLLAADASAAQAAGESAATWRERARVAWRRWGADPDVLARPGGAPSESDA
ncbi:serine/threonine-protein kinase PknK [Haliangium ochraceum]|uniref:Serine/threonine protein kinase n=1 Tax=Haliangium ochraceum (strain DSM 14365 / JCM 11303 / SMP-2) TaxID=502025 RepID=D0LW09_HALO1|nr:serine/threonine-protein kinase [Haliangium ochraceum]ACY14143.1 serine/threonine protein kinase [Haliangium ochraceum DSM 14365]